MSSFDFPKYQANQEVGNTGEAFFELFVTKGLGCIYRKVHREHDFGIDGYIDIVNNGVVSGRSVAVQIKCGDSYISKVTSGGIKYLGDNKHLNFLINHNLPVILVVLNSDCTKGYWVEFSVNATNPSSKSWWIEIPFENQLGTLNMTSLCDIAGIAEDYSEDIKASWAINSAMDEQSDMSFVLSKEEIEELDLSGINQMMERYFRTRDLLISNRNKAVFWIFGYDNDPRELYEIPEVRRWFQFTLEQGVPWFYLLDVGADHMSLPINMYSCCNISVNQLSCGSKSVVISSMSEINNWIEINFENLNRFADEKKIPDNIVKEVSEKVITSVCRLISG
ncbi:DUF4365 and DUF1817 domain-containing protein [Vibrio alginolyticus]|uniref:DUF4365 and DUF1817 domain-containing protein n=1 Tax=Vibrio alginolyticus TaxID=663 RepID=UPI0035521D8F